MKMQVEAYYFCILIKVAEKLVNGQYYSKCQQPEVITFIKDPILTNSCASVLYGSIMCNSIRGCDMFKMTMNTCMFHRSNAGCNEIGVHNTRMFKKRKSKFQIKGEIIKNTYFGHSNRKYKRITNKSSKKKVVILNEMVF